MSETKLSEEYDFLIKRGIVSKEASDLPSYITDNINRKFELREYQVNAITRFIEYFENEPNKQLPIKLLFNMATGSGKTLIMVLCMLYLYEKGYRNIVFFVDKTNIIRKTIENFMNKSSSKYLFNNEKIVIDGQELQIRKVDNFVESSDNALNILFSTIGGLHSKLNNPQENSVTFGDFEKHKTIFISDEAHHINADTKKNRNKGEEQLYRSREFTANRLVATHSHNILLEFTATIDRKDKGIYDKYMTRVLFEYDLKKFREDRYSKDVFLLQSNSSERDRIIQATIISQYRRHIASDNKLALKPVIFMKSKYANEGKKQKEEGAKTSTQNRDFFHSIIDSLTQEDIQKNIAIAKGQKEDNIYKQAFLYFENKKGLIEELKIEFSRERTVDVSDDSKIEQNLLAINSLEDSNNEIRVVFAVDKLNEGRDVLNLFDIVRLYDTRQTTKATNSEAQLVGRGARYYPFVLNESDDKFRRKFDMSEENPLRVIEQLHFHSKQNSEYISELRTALIESGIYKHGGREITTKVKDSFKQTKLYNQGHIFKNKRIINTRETNNSLSEVNVKKYYSFHYESLSSVHSIQAFGETTAYENPKEQLYTIRLSEISLHILNKAIDKVPYFYFNNLKKYFPKLNSTVDFIRDEVYLGGITVEIKTTNASLHHRDIFHKLVELLESIKNTIRANSSDYIGSAEFFPVKIAEVVTDKKMYIEKPKSSSTAEYGLSMSTESTKLRLNLGNEDCKFYVYDDDYGTDEEKYLVKMIYENLGTFTKDFEQVFLIRNQKIVELYSFDSGRRFEPDYLLFLGQETDKSNYYQLFIEPKGGHIEEGDRRKEDFLKAIGEEQQIVNLFEDKEYYIYGLPFYSEENKFKFMEVLNERLK